MAGYIMIDLEITDPEGFQAYLQLAGLTLKQYGGKVLKCLASSHKREIRPGVTNEQQSGVF